MSLTKVQLNFRIYFRPKRPKSHREKKVSSPVDLDEVANCNIHFSPCELRHVTTCWDAAHCTIGTLVVVFFFYDKGYWRHLADWKRKKAGALVHSVSNGKQHSGNFPTFGFPLSFNKFKHMLGQSSWFSRVFLSFFFLKKEA